MSRSGRQELAQARAAVGDGDVAIQGGATNIKGGVARLRGTGISADAASGS
jgi:hypothetical protein